MPPTRIRLVTRGDDAGSCRDANTAIRDAFEKGILRNAGVMAPGPAFEEAARMLKDLKGLCVGLHATLTDEWNESRWGPVLGAAKVPSLVMADGTFFKDTGAVWKHTPANDEVLAEVAAQLARARAAGLHIRYIDVHMGFDWFPGLRPRLHDFARAERLVFGQGFLPALPKVDGQSADPVERFIAQLEAAQAGKTYLVVTHPAYDTDQMRAMTYGDRKPGEIAHERDRDRRLSMDERILEYCRTHGVEPIRYADLTEASEGVLHGDRPPGACPLKDGLTG